MRGFDINGGNPGFAPVRILRNHLHINVVVPVIIRIGHLTNVPRSIVFYNYFPFYQDGICRLDENHPLPILGNALYAIEELLKKRQHEDGIVAIHILRILYAARIRRSVIFLPGQVKSHSIPRQFAGTQKNAVIRIRIDRC